MPTYTYEFTDRQGREDAGTFLIYQSIHDSPLTRHPESGRPVRRVITGGIAIHAKKKHAGQPSQECCPGCLVPSLV